MHEITIGQPEEVFILLNGRNPVQGYKLNFSIEGIGNFSVELPKEGFSAEKGKEAIQLEAKKIIGLYD